MFFSKPKPEEPVKSTYFVSWEETEAETKGSFVVELFNVHAMHPNDLYFELRAAALTQMGENGKAEFLNLVSVGKL